MIHVLEYKEQLFEAVANGSKSFVVLDPALDILPGDFLAINETHAHMEVFLDYGVEKEVEVEEITGRCCMVEVAYIEMTENNAAAIASIRPCDIATISQSMTAVTLRNLYEVKIYNRKKERNKNA